MRTLKICIMLVLVMALSSGTLASNPPFGGTFSGKMLNYDESTLSYDPGTSAPNVDDWSAAIGDNVEDGWAVFKITQVLITSPYIDSNGNSWYYATGDDGEPTPNPLWLDRDLDKQLVGVAYGIDDQVIKKTSDTGPTYDTWASGFKIVMWYQDKGVYDPSQGPIDREGTSGYATIGDGSKGPANFEKVLTLSAVDLGFYEGPDGITYSSHLPGVNYADGTGQHKVYMEVTGGTWASCFDTNTLLDVDGQPSTADIFLEVDLSLPDQNGPYKDWSFESHDPFKGANTPLPGAALLGILGLGSVAAIRWRVRRKVQE